MWNSGSGSRRECDARSSAALPVSWQLGSEEEAVGKGVIGVNPHERLSTVVVINAKGRGLGAPAVPEQR
jgi:hypothetical protein